MDLSTIKRLNIKYVLNATAQLENFHSSEPGITYMKINVKDKTGVDLSEYFNQTTQFIHEGLSKGGVLVHCVAGASRSVTFVLCYLMSDVGERLVLKDAYNWTKARRSIARPNDSFLAQLARHEIMLHDGLSSIAKTSEKIWNNYELNTLKRECVKGHLPSKLNISQNSCIIS